MKLKELFEIINIPQQTSKQKPLDSSIDIDSKKKVTTFDNYDIVKFDIKNNPDWVMFAILDDDKIVSSLTGILIDDVFYSKRSFTLESYRNKGFTTSLFKAVFHNLGYKICSDSELSPESRTIWKKLSKLFPNNTKIIDIRDEKLFDFTYDEKSEFYNNENYRFILESKSAYIDNSEILPDLNIYTNQQKFYKNIGVELL